MSAVLFRCLAAFSASAGLFAGSPASAGDLLRVDFPGDGGGSIGFAVEGGGEVLTLGAAGTELGKGVLRLGAETARVLAVDPVSRVVVFHGVAGPVSGFVLAKHSPTGGLLELPGDGGRARVEGPVERVGGKYLPFTLLRVRYGGSAAVRGTPLLDSRGRVAAVALQASGGAAGFAVPVEVLNRALAEARRNGRVDRAWLGLSLDPSVRVPRVRRTIDGSPAARAGLRAGDLLVGVGERRVEDYGDAVNAFFLLRPGIATTVRVRRDGVERQIPVEPEAGER
jgi:membrane-associated protease RseP (regulator of RpoE activity)